MHKSIKKAGEGACVERRELGSKISMVCFKKQTFNLGTTIDAH